MEGENFLHELMGSYYQSRGPRAETSSAKFQTHCSQCDLRSYTTAKVGRSPTLTAWSCVELGNDIIKFHTLNLCVCYTSEEAVAVHMLGRASHM